MAHLRRLSPALLVLVAFPSFVTAEDSSGWSDTAEFSYVVTAGNSETATLGFKNRLGRAWDDASIEIKAAGVRAESTTTTRSAIGSSTAFLVNESSVTSLTAENYALSGRYDRKLSERFFWYAGTGWERNRFAGVENRYTALGGVGNVWFDEETMKFRTDYAVTLTDQQDVTPDPAADGTFVGARFSWSYGHHFGEATVYGNDLIVDANLEETRDYRMDMTNSVAVSMNEHLALKLSLQWLYDNRPSLEAIPLSPAVGATPTGTVLVERDELDTVFTASLVVSF